MLLSPVRDCGRCDDDEDDDDVTGQNDEDESLEGAKWRLGSLGSGEGADNAISMSEATRLILLLL